MVDQMVLAAQKWVNATYASVPGYNPCTENGHTGWETMFSLTRALQHELGITELSDNFGPTTLADLTAYGNVGVGSSNMNMRIIAECALYCKGYTGGNLDGLFEAPTLSGLNSMAQDMGFVLDAPLNSVAPKMFKAMLNMDAYVLLDGGTTEIQTVQRWLNGAYFGHGQFFIGPCDGNFSRNVQIALVLAIQYQLGMTDDVVTGYIGPGTEAGLRTKAFVWSGSRDSGPTGFVRLFQAAVIFNGYEGHWGDGGGTFTDDLARVVKKFQAFCKLQQTGEGDYETWMSLLVSTGDPDRAGTAFDCMYPLNSKTIKTVKDAGYQIVGRYLTGGTNKVLTNSEIALINDNGLSFFPLYQEQGDAVEYFSYDQGYNAGIQACQAAAGFGIPYGTVIYFSVDFDALDSDITSAVIPHFGGIRDAVFQHAGGQYAIGVYGCRNTCLRLEAEGLTTRSFVSGMSTGYSGNLGFPLPDNWAFDQIKNKTLGSGTPGAVEIDNDIVSGRDLGLSSVTRPRDPNDGFYTLLIWLEARAGQWRDQGKSTKSRAELVAQYLRMQNPANDKVYPVIGDVSDEVFGAHDAGFINFVDNYAGMPDDSPLRDPKYLWDSDPSHFGASFGAVLTHGFPSDLTAVDFADFGSWGGDLLSVLGQFAQSGLPASDAYSFAQAHIAATGTKTFLSMSDYIADVDAVVLGMRCRFDSSLLLSTLFKQYYASPASAKQRYATFFANRFNLTADNALGAAKSMFGPIGVGRFATIRDAFWYHDFGDSGYRFCTDVPEEARTGVAQAFADRVVGFAN
jgi:peptidoglycan hydrolase-like protein with peptidoglycan-binding domain